MDNSNGRYCRFLFLGRQDAIDSIPPKPKPLFRPQPGRGFGHIDWCAFEAIKTAKIPMRSRPTSTGIGVNWVPTC